VIDGKAFLHAVSAFPVLQRLLLGQTRVDEKSNKITAIPRWKGRWLRWMQSVASATSFRPS